jgi:hypothetical protein
MRPQKITFGDMRDMGVRGVLIYAKPASVTEFDDSGDSAPPCQDSNISATTSNPRTDTGGTSASLDTTVEDDNRLTGEHLRNLLQAKQRSSPSRPRWVRANASPDLLYLKGVKKLSSVRTTCSRGGLA